MAGALPPAVCTWALAVPLGLALSKPGQLRACWQCPVVCGGGQVFQEKQLLAHSPGGRAGQDCPSASCCRLGCQGQWAGSSLSTHPPVLVGQVGGQRVQEQCGASAKVRVLVSTEMTVFAT